MHDEITTLAPSPGHALAAAGPAAGGLAAQAQAEVIARYHLAWQNPRNKHKVRETLLKECGSVALAAKAEYVLPFGSKPVQGASVRLAEAVARAMGNIDAASQIVSETPETRTMRVSVADMDTNVRFSSDGVLQKRLERRELKSGQVAFGKRETSAGHTVYLVEVSDMEILRAQQALVSRLLRNLLFKLIPPELLQEALSICQNTRMSAEPKDPVKRMVDAFGELGVGVNELEEFAGHPLDQCNAKEIDDLRKVYATVKDGEATWAAIKQQRNGGESSKPSTPAQNASTKLREELERRKGDHGQAVGVDPAVVADILEHDGADMYDGVEWYPRTGSPDGVVQLHEWRATEPAGYFRGDWELADEDLSGTVITNGREMNSGSQELPDAVREAVIWAFVREGSAGEAK